MDRKLTVKLQNGRERLMTHSEAMRKMDSRFTAMLTSEYGGRHCVRHYLRTHEVRDLRLPPFSGRERP